MTPAPTSTPTPYAPAGSLNLSTATLDDQPIRLALQANSGEGKTWSMTTFPNLVCANFDKNLQAHLGKNIIEIPFHDDAFVDSLYKRNTSVGARPNRRDAFLKWLRTEGPNIPKGYTLGIDSWTTLQDGFDQQTELEPVPTRSGGYDEFAFWAKKIDYSRDVLEASRSLKCHVVVTFHEQYLTDSKGTILVSKPVPLMQGKFQNRLGLYFSDWFRCVFIPAGGKLPDGTVAKVDTGLWITKSEVYGNCKTRLVGCPQFIPAHFDSFKAYQPVAKGVA